MFLRLHPHGEHGAQPFERILVNALFDQRADRLRLLLLRQGSDAPGFQRLHRKRSRNALLRKNMLRDLAKRGCEGVDIRLNTFFPDLGQKQDSNCNNGDESDG